ncbi:MAG TPA: efflux RND transporter periplasmic adaptor subunit [Puia sp.]|nr:efflux RND transporter periplasmic adaptor subunit [Puia sp.]
MGKILPTLIILCVAGFFSCKHKPPPADPVVPVNLYTVKSQKVFYYENFPATTQALSQVDLHPQVQGYVTGIFFTEGTRVRKGQKLYEIDKSIYQDAYEQAVSNLKVAQGNYQQAKQDADRYTYLNNHNAIAKQILDHAVIASQNAENQVKAAEDALRTAKTNLSFATIYAPFDGTIGFSQVKLGNLVVVGTTLLNTISTIDPIAVDFLINEKQLPHYEELQHPKKPHPDSLFTFLMPDNTVYPYTGKISVIDRAVDPQTGSIRVRLVFPNPNLTLKAGISCVVREHNSDTGPQMLIPGKAVVEQMGEFFVFVARDTMLVAGVDSSKKNDGNTGGGKEADSLKQKPSLHAFQKKVKVGQVIGANQVIKSGIQDGDQIVVDGVQAIHDGSEITTATKKPSPQKEAGGQRGQ